VSSAEKSFREFRNSPRPPAESTRITMRSKAVIVRNVNWMLEMTPKVSATSDPTASTQPMGLRAL
tara:strand:+ start:2057 stop:2251 length:195 start_codon:yes stop_codon:yes gene_type:complete